MNRCCRAGIEVDPGDWERVDAAVMSRRRDDTQPLCLVGAAVLQMMNTAGQVKIRLFRGVENTSVLSSELRLSKKMFDHHMPWGYSALFKLNHSDDVLPDLSVFDSVESC